MGCSSSRPNVLGAGPPQAKRHEPRRQRRCSRYASCSAASVEAALQGLSTCKFPSVDSARHNSGHLTSSVTSSNVSGGGVSGGGGVSATDLAAAEQPAAQPVHRKRSGKRAALAAALEAARQHESAAGGTAAGMAGVLQGIFSVPHAAVALLEPTSAESGAGTAELAAAGLARSLVQRQQTPRHEVVAIPDLQADARTRDSPNVTGQEAALRSYAGAPLLSSAGQLLGTLCICDVRPRAFGARACMLLANCAEVVARELEARGLGPRALLPSACAAAAVGGGGQIRGGSHSFGHRTSHDGSAYNGSRRGSGGQRSPLAPSQSSALLQHSAAPPPAANTLPVPLLDVSYGYTVGGVPVKRFSFERSGSGGSTYSRSSSSGGGGRFDTAAAAAVGACDIIRAAGGGPVVKRFSINGRRGSADLRTDTAKEGAISLYSATLPDELPGRVAADGTVAKRFSVGRPASGNLRSDTALALYSSLLGDADAADAAEGVKPAKAAELPADAMPPPPHQQQQQQQQAEMMSSAEAPAEHETTPPTLPRIPSGSPAPLVPPVQSAFATEAAQRSSPRDATISAAANAAARLLARAATAGGARPVSWRGPPTPPGMSRSSSLAAGSCRPSLDIRSGAAGEGFVTNELRTPSMERAASMPEGVARGQKQDTARAAAIRASASVDGGSILKNLNLKPRLPPTAPCRRSSSRLSSRSQPAVPAETLKHPSPPPPPPSALTLVGSKTSSELVDELAAELGLQQRPAAAATASCFRWDPCVGNQGVALIDASTPGWRLLYADEAFAAATGVPAGGGGGGTFWQHFELLNAEGPQAAAPWRHYGARVQRCASFGMTVAPASSTPESPAVKLSLSSAAARPLDENAAAIAVPAAGASEDAAVAGLYFATLQATSGQQSRDSFDGSSGSGHPSGSHHPGTNGSLSMRSEASGSLTPFAEVRLGGLLGKGSFGSVYEGLRGDQPVAVKVIHHMGQSGVTSAQELEATLGLRLEHENIVRTYDYATRTNGPASSFRRTSSRFASNSVGTRSGSAGATGPSSTLDLLQPACQLETWILLELCDSGSLQLANDAGKLRLGGVNCEADDAGKPPPDMQLLLACAVEIASAMHYLQGRGMLHGDLTCNNILLVEDASDPRGFRTKVSDFGLSRSMNTDSSLSTNTFGTVTHMPPELLSEGRLSQAADVYSFGVMLWEMYCQQRPWAGLRPIQVIMKKSQGFSSLAWPEGTPKPYRQLAEACMANCPTSRPTFADVEAQCRVMAAEAAAGTLTAGQLRAKSNGGGDASPRGLRKLPTL